MHNIIVNEPPSLMRHISKLTLKNLWKGAIAAMLIYSILLETVPDIASSIFPFGNIDFENIMEGADLSGWYASILINNVEYISVIQILYPLLLTGAITLGFSVYFLVLIRNRKSDLTLEFSGFDYYFRATSLYIVISIFVFLWALLLIVPGIIAFYRYSMAFYILADDPRKSVMQCIRESKEMMYGNKMNLFILHLSYIGWFILASMTTAIVAFILGIICAPILTETYIGQVNFLTMIIAVFASIPLCAVNAWLKTATAMFYDIASGRLIVTKDTLNQNNGNYYNDEAENNKSNTDFSKAQEFNGNGNGQRQEQSNYNNAVTDIAKSDVSPETRENKETKSTGNGNYYNTELPDTSNMENGVTKNEKPASGEDKKPEGEDSDRNDDSDTGWTIVE